MVTARMKRNKAKLCLSLSLVFLSPAGFLAATAPAYAIDAFDTNKRDPKINIPGLSSFSQIEKAPSVGENARVVKCEALLTDGGKPMQSGISWHIFSTIPGADGKLQLIASSVGGTHDFKLEPGDYFLNAAFGRATATKRLHVPSSGDIQPQRLVLDAGGLILRAISGNDTRIPNKELTFSIYTTDFQDDGERGLVLKNVKPDTVVRLNAGTYHIVSDYGKVNAVIRADIQVAAGKLVEATIQHRAAKVTFKLVSTPGGEAIADTAWSVLTAAGDIIAENVGAFATMILAEGNYTAIARNKEYIYQRDFTVKAGHNEEVELLLKRDLQEDTDSSDSAN